MCRIHESYWQAQNGEKKGTKENNEQAKQSALSSEKNIMDGIKPVIEFIIFIITEFHRIDIGLIIV
jgi:hypothetical protein